MKIRNWEEPVIYRWYNKKLIWRLKQLRYPKIPIKTIWVRTSEELPRKAGRIKTLVKRLKRVRLPEGTNFEVAASLITAWDYKRERF